MDGLAKERAARNGRSSTALREGELQFRLLLDKLPAGAYTCDANGLITYYNRRAAQVWGREPVLNDPIDRFCGSFRLFTSDGRPIAHDACWMALALRNEREYVAEEIIVERPDGTRITALAHASPTHDEWGRLTGAVNVLVDITPQKEAETVLRTADQAKNAFIATLAHELRNPLAPVRNAVRLLRSKVSDRPDARDAVEVIERQLTLMTRLLDDLLDVGRITANKFELREELIDLNEVVHIAVEISRPLIESGRHQLRLILPDEPVCINGDATRMAQVIANLLNNAATYTPDEGRISVSLECEGSDAILRVMDSGIGISTQMLPRVFEIYTQADRTLDHQRDGLGIGLALAQRIVELHGGRIQVRSNGEGHGSEFLVRLPGVLSGTSIEKQEEETMSLTQTGAGTRVLLVDDNRDVLESTRLVLEMMGFEVCTASTGAEAIERGGSFQPQAVLLDIGLPGMDGWAVARSMRESAWGAEAKLVAVTGWGRTEDIRRSEEAGFDHHLVKPMDPDELIELLADAGRAPLKEADAA